MHQEGPERSGDHPRYCRPGSPQDPQSKYQVHQIHGTGDQDPVHKADRKEELPAHGNAVVKIHLLSGMKIQEAREGQYQGRCDHQEAHDHILKADALGRQLSKLSGEFCICRVSDAKIIISRIFRPERVLLLQVCDTHGSQHRHRKKEGKEGKAQRPRACALSPPSSA